MNKFDYDGAIAEGYSDQEINDFMHIQNKSSNENSINQKLLKKTPNFDLKGAFEEGYSPDEINEFLKENQPKRSLVDKGKRLAQQFSLGAAQAHPIGFAYEIATGLGNAEGQRVFENRIRIGEDLDYLYDKNAGKPLDQWSKEDQEFYKSLEEQIKPGGEPKTPESIDLGLKNIAEKLTGADLEPEGTLEKSAHWLGFLKDPKKLYNGVKDFIKNPKSAFETSKDIIKEIIPGTKSLSALGAGTGLEMAEEGQFGPSGTIAAAIIGSILGHGPQALKYIAKNPKEFGAEAINLLTQGNSKKKWIEQLVNDANEMGVQLDAGTLTGSNLIRMAQARAAQSALSGPALDNFRKDLSQQIINKYKDLGDQIGNLTFENSFQAAEAIKNALKVEEQNHPFFKDYKKESRPLQGRVSVQEQPPYQQELLNRISPQEFSNDYVAGETLKAVADDIKNPLKEEFNDRWTEFNEVVSEIEAPQAELVSQLERFVAENEGSLLLGTSSAEYRVLTAAEDLLNRLRTEEGALIGVNLSNLIKTKRTLADVANWEIGVSDFSSRFKELVGNIDSAINRTLERFSPELQQEFQNLNAEYSSFKDVFENKNVRQLFEPKNQDYNSIYNSYISDPDKLRSLEDMFYSNPRGQEVINQVKRDFAQRITSKPNLNERDLRNLSQTLGPEFEQPINEFARLRQDALDHPLPRPQTRSRLGMEVPSSNLKTSTSLKGRKIEEASIQQRKKLYEYLKDKSSEQIMKQMDTVEGIRHLKKVLSLTPEGKELFKDLSRFKLEEMIGKKMKSDMNDHVKLGTFSNLLKTSKSKAIIKELVGTDAFNQLRTLQKLSSELEQSATKFFNASKSGTTVADVGLISTGVIGVFTGNPFMALGSLGSIIGLRVTANLLSNKEFLKLLEKAILTPNKLKFNKILEQMKPFIEKAKNESKALSTLQVEENQI